MNTIAYQIGFADSKHGIETFPAGGTDKFKTLADYKAGIIEAAKTCQDKDYAAGAVDAFNQ